MDKEERKAKRKAYYQANKEKIATYYQGNSEKIKRQVRRYYQANKESIITHKRTYSQANKEKIAKQHKDWKKANLENNRKYERVRRALKHTTQVESINEKIVYLRDGWICQICKKRVNKKLRSHHPMSPSLDHIIPLSKGGTHTYNNVQLAHFGCNVSKNDRVLLQGEQLRIF